MKFLILACMSIGVAGCATSIMPSDVASMDDQRLCKLKDAWVKEQTRVAITKELGNRKIPDCSDAYFACKSYGFEYGTIPFAQCKMQVTQQAIAASEMQDRAVQEMGLKMMQGPQQPIQTNCMSNPMGWSCTTH